MDSMWTNLLRQDERCCLAICLAVNCPHSGLTDDTWYPPLNRVKEDMNSTAGDRFIAYIISCLCGPLQGKEFVVKVAALLACLKVREAPEECDDGLPGNRTNLLFEFDKALNFDFGNMLITIKVLEQVLMFSARIWEIHAPEDAVHPGTLPATFDLCDDSVSRKMLYMYCCVRILFPDTHEATMHRTRAVFQMSSVDAAELLLDTLSDDELEAGGHSMCDVDEDLFDGEDDESYRSDMSDVESGEDPDLSEGGKLDDDHSNSDISDESYGPGAEEDDGDIE
ncbi:hypothetical protein CNYM01_14032 [Colletotrichum nymphaeae SA-01]|uniref:Uncharacterized protein n=1 Tax=Colletotrichum nymphaeae SA-01 TaxID=1460502 RepID=A0A135UT03_9PEZI|nr:hypothetical protein CNYM01_14032 [Colletotrichum nymphaeae SA-01]